MKIRKGNKENALLNGEWGKHVRKWMKKFTSSVRRTKNKKILNNSLKETLN